MLTKQKMIECARETGTRHVSSDGWMDMISDYSVTECPFSPVGELLYESTFRIEAITRCTYRPGGAMDSAKKLAHHMHRMMYGEIISRLHQISRNIAYSRREEVEAQLDSLIRDLEES